MFVPGQYFQINKFSGLLNRPLVRTWKLVPTLFVRTSEISGILEPGLTNHHCISAIKNNWMTLWNLLKIYTVSFCWIHVYKHDCMLGWHCWHSMAASVNKKYYHQHHTNVLTHFPNVFNCHDVIIIFWQLWTQKLPTLRMLTWMDTL